MKKLFSLLLISSCFTGWSACSSAEDADRAMLLLGQWDITEARRNGRKTESLKGLYFVFTTEGVFKTNLNGEPEEGLYKLHENTITTSEVQLPLTYEVVEVKDSLLILESVFQTYRFYFNLKRVADKNSYFPS